MERLQSRKEGSWLESSLPSIIEYMGNFLRYAGCFFSSSPRKGSICNHEAFFFFCYDTLIITHGFHTLVNVYLFLSSSYYCLKLSRPYRSFGYDTCRYFPVSTNKSKDLAKKKKKKKQT